MCSHLIMNYSGDVAQAFDSAWNWLRRIVFALIAPGIHQILAIAENTVAIEQALSQACYNCSFSEAITLPT